MKSEIKSIDEIIKQVKDRIAMLKDSWPSRKNVREREELEKALRSIEKAKIAEYL